MTVVGHMPRDLIESYQLTQKIARLLNRTTVDLF